LNKNRSIYNSGTGSWTVGDSLYNQANYSYNFGRGMYVASNDSNSFNIGFSKEELTIKKDSININQNIYSTANITTTGNIVCPNLVQAYGQIYSITETSTTMPADPSIYTPLIGISSQTNLENMTYISNGLQADKSGMYKIDVDVMTNNPNTSTITFTIKINAGFQSNMSFYIIPQSVGRHNASKTGLVYMNSGDFILLYAKSDYGSLFPLPVYASITATLLKAY
jgi:hypothetical protein